MYRDEHGFCFDGSLARQTVYVSLPTGTDRIDNNPFGSAHHCAQNRIIRLRTPRVRICHPQHKSDQTRHLPVTSLKRTQRLLYKSLTCTTPPYPAPHIHKRSTGMPCKAHPISFPQTVDRHISNVVASNDCCCHTDTPVRAHNSDAYCIVNHFMETAYHSPTSNTVRS